MNELMQQHSTWRQANNRLWRGRRIEPIALVPAPAPILPFELVPGWGAPVSLLGAPSALTLIRLVALKHGVAVADIKGEQRGRPIMAARDHAIALVYTHCRYMSTPQMGRLFGGRDHSTILHSLRKQKIIVPPVTATCFWGENPGAEGVLRMMLTNGASNAEVASALGVSRNSVAGRIRKMRSERRLFPSNRDRPRPKFPKLEFSPVSTVTHTPAHDG
jgi:hypothetical protein